MLPMVTRFPAVPDGIPFGVSSIVIVVAAVRLIVCGGTETASDLITVAVLLDTRFICPLAVVFVKVIVGHDLPAPRFTVLMFVVLPPISIVHGFVRVIVRFVVVDALNTVAADVPVVMILPPPTESVTALVLADAPTSNKPMLNTFPFKSSVPSNI